MTKTGTESASEAPRQPQSPTMPRAIELERARRAELRAAERDKARQAKAKRQRTKKREV